jgi:hypothetical protein
MIDTNDLQKKAIDTDTESPILKSLSDAIGNENTISFREENQCKAFFICNHNRGENDGLAVNKPLECRYFEQSKEVTTDSCIHNRFGKCISKRAINQCLINLYENEID